MKMDSCFTSNCVMPLRTGIGRRHSQMFFRSGITESATGMSKTCQTVLTRPSSIIRKSMTKEACDRMPLWRPLVMRFPMVLALAVALGAALFGWVLCERQQDDPKLVRALHDACARGDVATVRMVLDANKGLVDSINSPVD